MNKALAVHLIATLRNKVKLQRYVKKHTMHLSRNITAKTYDNAAHMANEIVVKNSRIIWPIEVSPKQQCTMPHAT